MTEKRCTCCGELKPLVMFRRASRSADGYGWWCKACSSQRDAWSYERNRERRRASREQRASDPDHRAEARERARRWYAANRERALAYRRLTREGPRREDILQRKRADHATNRERANARRRESYYRNHLANIVRFANARALAKGAPGTFTVADVERLVAEQAGRCAYCAADISERYHIDHVRPYIRRGTNWPDNLALACPTCNFRKRHMTGEEFRVMLREEEVT